MNLELMNCEALPKDTLRMYLEYKDCLSHNMDIYFLTVMLVLLISLVGYAIISSILDLRGKR